MSSTVGELKTRIMESARKMPTKAVDVEEWGEGIFVRKFRASEADALADILDPMKPNASVGVACECFAKICAMSLCEENGERIFANGAHADLMELPIPILKRVAESVLDFNDLTERATEALAGNLQSGERADSPSI